MFVDVHTSSIKLSTETRKNIWFRRLVTWPLIADDLIPIQTKPLEDMYSTKWHWDSLWQRIPLWICFGQTGSGVANSIQNSPHEVCVVKTDTRMSHSIPDQSMWDLCSINWHWGSGFHPRPVYVGCASDKVALRQALTPVIRFTLVKIIPPTLPHSFFRLHER